MKLVRIDSDREINQEFNTIAFETESAKYEFYESADGSLTINKSCSDDDRLIIEPCVANQIRIK